MAVHLSLLGNFRFTHDDVPIEIGHAGERVLALLALAERRCVSRERVASLLWPERPRPRTLANLRSALWRLPARAREQIAETSHGLSLSTNVSVDIELLDLGDDLSVPAEVASAPLLPGWYDDWLIVSRERIELRRLAILEEIASAHLSQRNFADAIDLALVAIAEEPFRESLHRIVIRAHIDEGNLSEAKLHFERLRSVLARELGVEPSKTTMALVEDSIVTMARR